MLWKVGDFFLLPDLKRDARNHWSTLFEANLPRICSIDPTAFSIDEMSDAIRAAYTIPNAMWWRTAMAKFICIARRNALKSDKLFELIEEIPQLAVDILKSLRSPPVDEVQEDLIICEDCFELVKESQDGVMWHRGPSISDEVVAQHLKCIEWSPPEAGKP